ncbi:MAG: hypothetical protein AAB222_06765, partial [Candidatus Binatota bacterium]
MKIRKVEILGLVFLAVLTMLSVAWGQSGKPTSLADLAAYTGADREQMLVAGAKIEGKVFWYTSLTGGPNQEIPKAFEAKYPGVKVETYRGSSKDLIAKILAEAQAKRYLMDTIEGTLPILGSPLGIPTAPAEVRLAPPTLGQHTEEILQEL